jgi:hypothetical protein
MAHFRFYTNGAPFPGTCVFSGENRNLWEVGNMTVQGQVLPVLLSDRVLQELAAQAGFVTSKSYAELNSTLTEKINTQKAQLDVAPQFLKRFQHDINNLIGEFVTGLASVTPTNKPVQPKGDQADTGDADTSAKSQHPSGKGKSQASKSSAEPAEL